MIVTMKGDKLHLLLQYQKVPPNIGSDWDPCNHSLENAAIFEQTFLYLASSIMKTIQN